MPMPTQAELGYWYRLEGPGRQASWKTDPVWTVSDGAGAAVGPVTYTAPARGRASTYWLADTNGVPCIGITEPTSMGEAMRSPNLVRVLLPDGTTVGAFDDHIVWWGSAQVAKFDVRTHGSPHVFGGAWMWDLADRVVASVTQTRPPGVGAGLSLSRVEPLVEPIATAALVFPFVVHHHLLRTTKLRAGDNVAGQIGPLKADLL